MKSRICNNAEQLDLIGRAMTLEDSVKTTNCRNLKQKYIFIIMNTHLKSQGSIEAPHKNKITFFFLKTNILVAQSSMLPKDIKNQI